MALRPALLMAIAVRSGAFQPDAHQGPRISGASRGWPSRSGRGTAREADGPRHRRLTVATPVTTMLEGVLTSYRPSGPRGCPPRTLATAIPSYGCAGTCVSTAAIGIRSSHERAHPLLSADRDQPGRGRLHLARRLPPAALRAGILRLASDAALLERDRPEQPCTLRRRRCRTAARCPRSAPGRRSARRTALSRSASPSPRSSLGRSWPCPPRGRARPLICAVLCRCCWRRARLLRRAALCSARSTQRPHVGPEAPELRRGRRRAPPRRRAGLQAGSRGAPRSRPAPCGARRRPRRGPLSPRAHVQAWRCRTSRSRARGVEPRPRPP